MHVKLNALFLVAALGLVACDKDDDATEEPDNGSFPTETLTASPTTIRVSDLPAPFASQSVTNYPQVLNERPANARLKVPRATPPTSLPMTCPRAAGWRWLPTATYSWPR
ncbi:hypothetical protein [Hymenobacter cellulosilyticus]|uniref:Uncharacterized protein n=1 Tax=Hymenobacter cellulosilyticus TaxID=2932248 RepID=A0A8T9Q9R8_9BACT|nr:hypothetical protein [Hymenobacter cellulosilyticus]UOQ72868.1 hypothetical protein MUN79_02445 [Hymenobacter cellulosilyticus]